MNNDFREPKLINSRIKYGKLIANIGLSEVCKIYTPGIFGDMFD
jgi:hypothetical protein